MPFKYNPFTGTLDLTSSEPEYLEQYVPYESGIADGSIGVKGQWSWNPTTQTFLVCIATNTWVNLYTKELIDKQNFLKLADVAESYVPYSKITSSNADGVKGQWSYNGLYYYKCIASNTWVRYAVEVDF